MAGGCNLHKSLNLNAIGSSPWLTLRQMANDSKRPDQPDVKESSIYFVRYIEYAHERGPDVDRVYLLQYTGNETAIAWLGEKISNMRDFRLYREKMLSENQVDGLELVLELLMDNPPKTGPPFVVLDGVMYTNPADGKDLKKLLCCGGICKLFKD